MSSGSTGLRYVRRSSRNAAGCLGMLILFGGMGLTIFIAGSTAGDEGMTILIILLGILATFGLGLLFAAESNSGTDPDGCERIDQAIDAIEREVWRSTGKAPAATFDARHKGELAGLIAQAEEDRRQAAEAVGTALLDGATHPARLEDLLLRRIATTRRLGVLLRFASPLRAESLLKEAYGFISDYKSNGTGGPGFFKRKSLVADLDWTEGGEKRWGDSVVGLTYDPND